jgi:hypothetical protein
LQTIFDDHPEPAGIGCGYEFVIFDPVFLKMACAL